MQGKSTEIMQFWLKGSPVFHISRFPHPPAYSRISALVLKLLSRIWSASTQRGALWRVICSTGSGNSSIPPAPVSLGRIAPSPCVPRVQPSRLSTRQDCGPRTKKVLHSTMRSRRIYVSPVPTRSTFNSHFSRSVAPSLLKLLQTLQAF